MSTEPKEATSAPEPPPKKPYHRPVLEVHGTVRELTGHVGNAGKKVDPPPYASGKFTTG